MKHFVEHLGDVELDGNRWRVFARTSEYSDGAMPLLLLCDSLRAYITANWQPNGLVTAVEPAALSPDLLRELGSWLVIRADQILRAQPSREIH